jgi:hypothetical protein
MQRWAFRALRWHCRVLRESGLIRWRPLWKATRWLYRRVCPAEGTILERIHGRWWHLDLGDRYFTQSLLLTGQHEEWEVPIFLKALRPGQCVVDIGAHVGFYTVLAAERVGPSGRVIAFEPDPGNRALLEANVRDNALTQATVMARRWGRSPALRGYGAIPPTAALINSCPLSGRTILRWR